MSILENISVCQSSLNRKMRSRFTSICPVRNVSCKSLLYLEEKLIGFWELDGGNHMITCSVTAGD